MIRKTLHFEDSWFRKTIYLATNFNKTNLNICYN